MSSDCTHQPSASPSFRNATGPSARPSTGPDHPEVATRLSNLAAILRDLGQAEAARPLQERALAITQLARSADQRCLAAR